MLKVLLVQEDQQVLKVLKVLQDLVVELVLRVQREQQVLRVIKVIQEQQELYLLLEQECYSNKLQHQLVGQKTVLVITEH